MHPPELVRRLLELVDSHYVLPERVGAIRARIEARLAAGAYSDLGPAGLAETITGDLRTCAGDQHFKLVYRSEPGTLRTTATEETPEEIAEFRRIARFNNYGCGEVRRLPGNVGCWRIDEFYDLIDGSGPTFQAAMQLLGNMDALIVDVRRNTGGDPDAVALVCSFFFDVEPIHLETLESRDGTQRQWWTLAHLDCDRYLDKEVFVLIDAGTYSAAEQFAYDLQAHGRATLVGQTTAGAAHARDQFQMDEHYLINIPTLRPVNPRTKTNWAEVGVVPDVPVAGEEALARFRHEWSVGGTGSGLAVLGGYVGRRGRSFAPGAKWKRARMRGHRRWKAACFRPRPRSDQAGRLTQPSEGGFSRATPFGDDARRGAGARGAASSRSSRPRSCAR